MIEDGQVGTQVAVSHVGTVGLTIRARPQLSRPDKDTGHVSPHSHDTPEPTRHWPARKVLPFTGRRGDRVVESPVCKLFTLHWRCLGTLV